MTNFNNIHLFQVKLASVVQEIVQKLFPTRLSMRPEVVEGAMAGETVVPINPFLIPHVSQYLNSNDLES